MANKISRVVVAQKQPSREVLNQTFVSKVYYSLQHLSSEPTGEKFVWA
jgi:hypothetical protein